MKRTVFLSLFFILFLPSFVFAESSAPENVVRIEPLIEVNDPVSGDVIAIGNTVTIRGPVEGDVLSLAGTLMIEGEVSGSVRAAGGTVIVNAPVRRNVTVAGGNVLLQKDAFVGESMAVFAGTLTINGEVMGRLDVRADQMSVTGTVHGPTVRYQIADQKEARRAWIGQYLFRRIISLFGLLVVGLVFISLLRNPTATVIRFALERPLPSFGWGIVFFFTPPIISVLLLVTIIGGPLSLIVFLLWIVALYLAQVLAILTLGVKMVVLLDKKRKIASLLWPLILGGLVWIIFTSVPLVGWVLWFLGTAWGLGAFADMSRRLLLLFQEKR